MLGGRPRILIECTLRISAVKHFLVPNPSPTWSRGDTVHAHEVKNARLLRRPRCPRAGFLRPVRGGAAAARRGRSFWCAARHGRPASRTGGPQDHPAGALHRRRAGRCRPPRVPLRGHAGRPRGRSEPTPGMTALERAAGGSR